MTLRGSESDTMPMFGQRYVVRGILRGPVRREAGVVTVWIVPTGEDVPRLLTAYPGDAS